MNGYTYDLTTFKRLQNLAAQIPQAVRADTLAQCVDENPHTFERNLTVAVLSHSWVFETERRKQVAEAADIVREFGDHEQ